MIRRRFIQMTLIAASSAALSLISTAVSASSRGDGGASRSSGASNSGASNSGASNSGASNSGASRSSGASLNRASQSSSNDGQASRSRGGSRGNDDRGGSIYCSTDANGNQVCNRVNSDGLEPVTDSDLDDVLKSFN